jgi:hypothetical protein
MITVITSAPSGMNGGLASCTTVRGRSARLLRGGCPVASARSFDMVKHGQPFRTKLIGVNNVEVAEGSP